MKQCEKKDTGGFKTPMFMNTSGENLLTIEEKNLVNLIAKIIVNKTLEDAKKSSQIPSLQQRWTE